MNQSIGIAEHEFCQIACKIRFADTGGAEEKERTDGATRILEVGAGATQGLRDRFDCFILSDDARLQFILHFQEFIGFRLLHAAKRDTGPFRDDGHDVIVIDIDDRFLRLSAPFLQGVFELLLRIFLGIAQSGGFFKVLFGDGSEFVLIDRFDFALQFLDRLGASHLGNASARACFIENIDRLIRQIATGEIARGEFHGCLNRGGGKARFVVRFILRAEAVENFDGILFAGFIHLHLLEATFQSGILFDVLAVFIQRGCADALHFRAAEGGFDDVRGIHGTFR